MTPWRHGGGLAMIILPLVWSLRGLRERMNLNEQEQWLIILRDAVAIALTSVMVSLGLCWAVYQNFAKELSIDAVSLANQMGDFIIVSFRDIISVGVSLGVLWLIRQLAARRVQITDKAKTIVTNLPVQSGLLMLKRKANKQ